MDHKFLLHIGPQTTTKTWSSIGETFAEPFSRPDWGAEGTFSHLERVRSKLSEKEERVKRAQREKEEQERRGAEKRRKEEEERKRIAEEEQRRRQ